MENYSRMIEHIFGEYVKPVVRWFLQFSDHKFPRRRVFTLFRLQKVSGPTALLESSLAFPSTPAGCSSRICSR
jgi:hypothetical protein